MFGTKIVLVRVFVLAIMVIATFAVGWYLFERYTQMNKRSSSVQNEELNNPRLNTALLDKVSKEFEIRLEYVNGDQIEVVIPESDPFNN